MNVLFLLEKMLQHSSEPYYLHGWRIVRRQLSLPVNVSFHQLLLHQTLHSLHCR